MRNLFIKFIFTLLSLSAQISSTFFIIYFSICGRFDFSLYIFLSSVCLSFILLLLILPRRENASYKLSWVFPVFVLPYLTFFFFIFAGKRKTSKKYSIRSSKIVEDSQKYLEREALKNPGLAENDMPLYALIKNCGNYPAFKSFSEEYFESGEAFKQNLFDALNSAKKCIFLEYYTLQDGVFLDELCNILIKKASEGIYTCVIYDDAGCKGKMSKATVRKLKRNNVEILAFNSIIMSKNSAIRLHSKMAVIDGQTAFTGGLNISDEYINLINPYGHFKDGGIKISGGAVDVFTVMFLRIYELITGKIPNYEKYLSEKKSISGNTAENGNGFVQPFSGSPGLDIQLSKNVFLELINMSKKYVLINTPYLLLDDAVASALMLKARSGVDVKIIMPSVPDKKFVLKMSRSFYPALTESGVKIFEYTPGFIHVKNVISDGRTAYCGTCNFDNFSFYLHYQCGLILYNCDVIKTMENDFQNTLLLCREYKITDNRKPKFLSKIYNNILRIFAPFF